VLALASRSFRPLGATSRTNGVANEWLPIGQKAPDLALVGGKHQTGSLIVRFSVGFRECKPVEGEPQGASRVWRSNFASAL